MNFKRQIVGLDTSEFIEHRLYYIKFDCSYEGDNLHDVEGVYSCFKIIENEQIVFTNVFAISPFVPPLLKLESSSVDLIKQIELVRACLSFKPTGEREMIFEKD